jgi:bifunctional non-homologous end joining protein LigD
MMAGAWLRRRSAARVRLTSRNGLDHTRRFPELVKAVAELDVPSLVLDGEIAIFDRQLISRFEWLPGSAQK